MTSAFFRFPSLTARRVLLGSTLIFNCEENFFLFRCVLISLNGSTSSTTTSTQRSLYKIYAARNFQTGTVKNETYDIIYARDFFFPAPLLLANQQSGR